MTQAAPQIKPALEFFMSVADQFAAALAILHDQVIADQAARLADTAAATAASDAANVVLAQALAAVQAFSAKLPPLPVVATPAPPVG
jgi:hypothetical protein